MECGAELQYVSLEAMMASTTLTQHTLQLFAGT